MIRGRLLDSSPVSAWRIARVVAVAAAVVVIAAACDEGISSGISVENRTDHELKFEVVLTDKPYKPVANAPPHSTSLVIPAAIMTATCTTGGMVAYDADGTEIARHDEPLCIGDRWVIELPGPTDSTHLDGSASLTRLVG